MASKAGHRWLVGLITSLVGTITSILRGDESSFFGNLSWHGFWLIWCGLSFLVIYLARRFPIEVGTLKRNLAIQFFLAFAVVMLNVAIEFSIQYFILSANGGGIRRPSNFLLSLFAYKFYVNLIIYWAIVGATNAYDYYVKFQQSETVSSQLEAKLAQSELQALKMQLQPHFLFNTHHSIISLMLKEKNEEAIKMLTQLSDLLRTTLQKTNEQLSSLKEEMETLDLYLDIQKVRFEDRLEICTNASRDILDAEVPYLILQPLVENALQHGIGNLPEGGRLIVEAHEKGGKLLLSVGDNGLGMGGGTEKSNGNGIGLKTTRSRLEQLYGDRHIFTINSSPETGTTVSIAIPFKRVVPQS